MREHPISKQRYRAGEHRGGGEKRGREDERKKGRDEMQGAQAASIMWFGAEAICTYCSS